MPSINISEEDFGHIFNAAHAALDGGRFGEAAALDKIARKINAALSHDNPSARIARMAGGRGNQASWTTQPSVFQGRKLPPDYPLSNGRPPSMSKTKDRETTRQTLDIAASMLEDAAARMNGMDDYMRAALRLFTVDPPDTDFQQ